MAVRDTHVLISCTTSNRLSTNSSRTLSICRTNYDRASRAVRTAARQHIISPSSQWVNEPFTVPGEEVEAEVEVKALAGQFEVHSAVPVGRKGPATYPGVILTVRVLSVCLHCFEHSSCSLLLL